MSSKLYVALAAVIMFVVICATFRIVYRRSRYFFFDPRDYFDRKPTDRRLPAAAETATFEPMLKNYLGVTQLLVTVAAASIAFGSSPQGKPLGAPKLFLACSIFYGVSFCALLLWRYDEYMQNVESYTLRWYSIIFASGFSSLLCFMTGYLLWGFSL